MLATYIRSALKFNSFLMHETFPQPMSTPSLALSLPVLPSVSFFLPPSSLRSATNMGARLARKVSEIGALTFGVNAAHRCAFAFAALMMI